MATVPHHQPLATAARQSEGVGSNRPTTPLSLSAIGRRVSEDGVASQTSSLDYRTNYNSTQTPHTASVTTLQNVQVKAAIGSQ